MKKSNNRKKKILVADDDPGILDSLKIMLDEFGYEVETTVNGHGVYNIKKELPDLILLDLWMSGIDGRDVCKHLKGQKETKHIPIIICSANKETEKIAKEARADNFITKPFDMQELLNKITRHIA